MGIFDRDAPRDYSDIVYTCTCMGCLNVIRVGHENLRSYINGIAECPDCGQYAGWNVRESLAWSGTAFARQIDYFEIAWTRWLESPEGKLAQERARYNL